MNDQNQLRAIPAQSMAIVMSGIITTCGVVISACIQTGWIGKPTPEMVDPPQPTVARAYFTGVIEATGEEVPSAARQGISLAAIEGRAK